MSWLSLLPTCSDDNALCARADRIPTIEGVGRSKILAIYKGPVMDDIPIRVRARISGSRIIYTFYVIQVVDHIFEVQLLLRF